MPFETIHKDPTAFRVPPNLSSYEEDRADFSWERARSCLDGPPGGGLNMLMRLSTGTPSDRRPARWHCVRLTSAATPRTSATQSFAARPTNSRTC